MHVICIIEDEWSAHRSEVLRSARLHAGQVQFCVLRVAFKADADQVHTQPLANLLDLLDTCWEASQNGAPAQIVVNDTCIPLSTDYADGLWEAPRGLSVHSLVQTLQALFAAEDRAKEVREKWFIASDARLEDKTAQWPLPGIPESEEFRDELRRSTSSVQQELAGQHYTVLGLFCVWLLQRQGMRVALLTSRVSEEDTRGIIHRHITKGTGWCDKVYQDASEQLGFGQFWAHVAEKAPEKLNEVLKKYSEAEARIGKDLHKIAEMLQAAGGSDTRLLTCLQTSAGECKTILDGLGCSDPDIADAVAEYKSQNYNSFALMYAKTKVLVYRGRGELFLFDLLHHAASVLKNPVRIDGEEVLSLQEFQELMHHETRIILNPKDVQQLFRRIRPWRGAKLEHSLEILEDRLRYRMYYPAHEIQEQVLLHKLLYASGDTADLLWCMRKLFRPQAGQALSGEHITVTPGKCSQDTVAAITLPGVHAFVWPEQGQAGGGEGPYRLALVGMRDFSCGVPA